jgi:tetratricopeptide (TPR) repeat protein
MQRNCAKPLRKTLIALLTMTAMAGAAAPEPILIQGIREPDEMRVEPFPINNNVPSAPERLLQEAMEGGDMKKLSTLLPALNQILAKYPDYSDGYVMRLFAFCEDNDRRGAMSDLSSALKFIDASRTGKDSVGSLLSTRAKLTFADGDYAGAMDQLDRALRADLKNAPQFTSSGAVEPQKTASVCGWAEPDMDELVRRFPADYRSHMFRGLYYSFFVTFDRKWVEPAISSLTKATELNPKSSLPYFFKARILGSLFVFQNRLNERGRSDAARDSLNKEIVDEFNKALVIDQNLLPALIGRADGRPCWIVITGIRSISSSDRRRPCRSRPVARSRCWSNRGFSRRQNGPAFAKFHIVVSLISLAKLVYVGGKFSEVLN